VGEDVGGVGKTTAGSRLQLMSCSAPITVPCGVVIGTTSMDMVR